MHIHGVKEDQYHKVAFYEISSRLGNVPRIGG